MGRGYYMVTPAVFRRFLRPADTGCIEWTGAVNSDGYGSIRFRGATQRAHRIAWKLAHGLLKETDVVCHSCDNRKCCNVEHMFLGSQADNAKDMWQKGRGKRPPPPTKLTPDDVHAIRALRRDFHIQLKPLAAAYDTTFANIAFICKRRTWTST